VHTLTPIPKRMETPEDRERQQAAREVVQKWLGDTYEVLPTADYAHHDWEIWLIHDGKPVDVVYLGEYKYRNCASDEFDVHGGIAFSLKRYYRLRNNGTAFNCPVVVFFEFTDGLFYIRLSDLDPTKKTSISRRVQREGSTNETEDVLLIPSSLLIQIREKS